MTKTCGTFTLMDVAQMAKPCRPRPRLPHLRGAPASDAEIGARPFLEEALKAS